MNTLHKNTHLSMSQTSSPSYQDISGCVMPNGEPVSMTGVTSSCSCDPRGRCVDNCSCLKDCGPPYDENGLLSSRLLRTDETLPIYECNSSCACGTGCANKSTQRGANPSLEVFHTGGRKGYGVRTNADLSEGEFVCEYIGELISLSDAKMKLSTLTIEEQCYVVIYKEHFGKTRTLCTCVDATVKGNIARFINHSCAPNLIMLPVRAGCIAPRLCLFTLEPVAKGTELCFSYGNSTTGAEKPCYCGNKKCQRFLPFEANV